MSFSVFLVHDSAISHCVWSCIVHVRFSTLHVMKMMMLIFWFWYLLIQH